VSTSRSVRTCSGSSYSFYKAPSVIASSTQRGFTCSDVNDYSRCLHVVATSSVVAAGRAFFGCSNMTGVELENQDDWTCPFTGAVLQTSFDSLPLFLPLLYCVSPRSSTILTCICPPSCSHLGLASSAIAGSHWEQRLLEQELMAPIVNTVMKISPMTLAMFADSGWYDVDYSQADQFATGVCSSGVR
jgi:hypothetical protein